MCASKVTVSNDSNDSASSKFSEAEFSWGQGTIMAETPAYLQPAYAYDFVVFFLDQVLADLLIQDSISQDNSQSTNVG